MADALFDATQYQQAPAEPPAKVSPDVRRRQRQQQAIGGGSHPLSAALGYHIPLHPEAPRSDDRKAPGPRCGSCWYRRSISTNGGAVWPKCLYGASNDTDTEPGVAPRVSHGAGTDVRRWWPACRDYSPGDPRVSDDAARYVSTGGA